MKWKEMVKKMNNEEIKKETQEEIKEEQKTEKEHVENKKEKPKKKKENKEIEVLKEENKALQEKILRISAEMQNMRKRYEEEIARLHKYEGLEFAKEILPTIDNFERAIKLDDTNLDDELSKFLSGFKMIYTNLVNILNAKEIKEIDCLNQDFDPNYMEAVLTAKLEGIEKNKVVEVLQKGYMYKDKLLRPAMVKVSE